MTKGQLKRANEIQRELINLEDVYEKLARSSVLRFGDNLNLELLEVGMDSRTKALNAYLSEIAKDFKRECKIMMQNQINELKREFENL